MDRRIIEIIFAIVIGILAIVFYPCSRELISGMVEIKWAVEGIFFSSHNVMMLILFSIAGGGTAWIVYRYSKRSRLLAAIISALAVSFAMTLNTVSYWVIPAIVCLFVLYIKFRERNVSTMS